MSESALVPQKRALRPLQLLLIDDNPHDRELLVRELRRHFAPLNIEPVRDEQEFERALAHGTFDAAVVDYQMRWSNGLEALRRIKQARPQCPVLMFTASGSEAVAVQAMKEGLDDYITKTPKHYARLPFALEGCVDRLDQRRELELAHSKHRVLIREVSHGEQRLAVALRAAGMMTWEYEPASEELRVSANAPEIVGTVWKNVGDLFAALDAQDAAALKVAYERALSRGEPFAQEVRATCRPAQRQIWLELRGQPMLDEDDRVGGMIGIAMDITARKRAEEALRAAKNRKDVFIATLAHELRNPLAPMRYATQLLAPDVPAEIAAQARQMMERQLAHLAGLLDDLLDTSRLERGALQLHRETIDLREAVEVAVEAARAQAAEANLELQVQLPAQAMPVVADRARLVQVVGNLLNNAIKYTPSQGHVSITGALEASEAVVRVSDDGIGIAADMLPKMFELFVQAQPSGERAGGGLGVGLSLAHELVELHGGRLEGFSGGLNRGSEFVVRLPRSAERLGRAPAPSPAPRASHATVLVVDDNVDAADTLCLMLKFSGYQTRVAYTAASGLEIAEQVRPEVILLDIGLPEMSGHDFARRVRSERWGAGIRLVAISGWGGEHDRRASQEAGFEEHFTKPADPQMLLRLLGRIMHPSA
jgi:PAS domain S-box-containing protein